ncbi:unnamed protein product [marine sediment metagenome]|uniref:Uncharacterized protein n=1 Tax=marine sediment metagenome TaxID=412755 RepID=X0YUH0_9ZZZZ
MDCEHGSGCQEYWCGNGPDADGNYLGDESAPSKLEKALALEREATTLPYAVRNLNLPPIDGGNDGTS